MSEWISVDERLPEEDSLVVVAHFFGGGFQPDAAVCWFQHNKFVIYLDGIRAEGCCGGAEVRLDTEVTHWMPLPPAPDAE